MLPAVELGRVRVGSRQARIATAMYSIHYLFFGRQVLLPAAVYGRMSVGSKRAKIGTTMYSTHYLSLGDK